MFEKTGVDGIMIGRGAFGNPWIFEKIIHFLKTGEKIGEIPSSQKLKVIKEHLELLIEEKGEIVAIKEFRKHLSSYSKNLANSSSFRILVNKIEDKNELIQVLENFFVDEK